MSFHKVTLPSAPNLYSSVPPPGLMPKFHPRANVAQSYGTELSGPGLMSFHNVTLPSAPNLYSSVPSVGLVPWSHAAFWKMDEGVESGSCWKGSMGLLGGNLLTPALTSIGLKSGIA